MTRLGVRLTAAESPVRLSGDQWTGKPGSTEGVGGWTWIDSGKKEATLDGRASYDSTDELSDGIDQVLIVLSAR